MRWLGETHHLHLRPICGTAAQLLTANEATSWSGHSNMGCQISALCPGHIGLESRHARTRCFSCREPYIRCALDRTFVGFSRLPGFPEAFLSGIWRFEHHCRQRMPSATGSRSGQQRTGVRASASERASGRAQVVGPRARRRGDSGGALAALSGRTFQVGLPNAKATDQAARKSSPGPSTTSRARPRSLSASSTEEYQMPANGRGQRRPARARTKYWTTRARARGQKPAQ
jgi:hypothetical protein